MPDGYYPDYSNNSDEQLDEFLCEYVDGTMDAAVREAFEEYLDINPDLANHARCLCKTRNMLCSYGGRLPSSSLQDQIRHRVACELNRQNRNDALLFSRLGSAAMLTSAVSLLLILVMIAGITAANESRREGAGLLHLDKDSSESMVLVNDAYAHQGATLPLEFNGSKANFSFMGPPSVLPAIDLLPVGWHEAGTPYASSEFRLLANP